MVQDRYVELGSSYTWVPTALAAEASAPHADARKSNSSLTSLRVEDQRFLELVPAQVLKKAVSSSYDVRSDASEAADSVLEARRAPGGPRERNVVPKAAYDVCS
jgi:hypothetical protein